MHSGFITLAWCGIERYGVVIDGTIRQDIEPIGRHRLQLRDVTLASPESGVSVTVLCQVGSVLGPRNVLVHELRLVTTLIRVVLQGGARLLEILNLDAIQVKLGH